MQEAQIVLEEWIANPDIKMLLMQTFGSLSQLALDRALPVDDKLFSCAAQQMFTSKFYPGTSEQDKYSLF